MLRKSRHQTENEVKEFTFKKKSFLYPFPCERNKSNKKKDMEATKFKVTISMDTLENIMKGVNIEIVSGLCKKKSTQISMSSFSL